MKVTARLSMSPRMSPPSIAPRMFPMPPRPPAEGGAQEERPADHPADVHPHDRSHLAVLGHRPDRPPEARPLDEQVEAPHHHGGHPDHHQDEDRDVDPGDLEAPGAGEEQ